MIIATALGQAAAGVAMSAAALYVLHQEGLGCWWSASLKHVAPLRRELRSAFGWNYALVTFNGLLEQVPVMLLGYRLGPEEAGFYRLAMSLATIGSYLESSLERVVYPILAARWSAGEREDLKTAVKRWTLQGGVPSGTLVCMLMLLLPALVPWMFGSGYRPVVAGAQIIMIGAAVSAVCFWLHAFYYASGDIALWTKAYGLHAILVMGFAWFCLQQWGFIGLAGLTATGKVLFTVTMVVVLVMPWEKTRENLHFSISR
jgi:O-antigen/teichoic acid export membrane protein